MFSYKINLKIALVTILPLLLVYLPFLLHLKHLYFLNLGDSGMQQIYKNWDGPNFVLNAITGYDPIQIAKHTFAPKPYEYYANHFPLYSWFISLLGPVIGYFQSAVVVNICSNLLLNIVFYKWISKYSHHPLWLTIVRIAPVFGSIATNASFDPLKFLWFGYRRCSWGVYAFCYTSFFFTSLRFYS
jgi:hypothetical protein